jgi:predicted enzyme related to lactoylglutathione lyase
MSLIGQPVPELPVADVELAQQHYKDALGFEIGWLYPGKGIGAVSRGNVAIFFRKRNPPFEPAVHWVFAEDIDATYQELKSLGANIVDPLEKKPWGFTAAWTGTSSISTMTDQMLHDKRLELVR